MSKFWVFYVLKIYKMCEVVYVIVNNEHKENMWSNSRIDKILISYKCLYIVKVSQFVTWTHFYCFRKKKCDRLWLGISFGWFKSFKPVVVTEVWLLMFSCLNDLNFGRVLTPAEIDDYLAEV